MKERNANLPMTIVTPFNGMKSINQGTTNNKKIQNYVFDLNQIVGKGNFSRVYKAINITNNQTVAIKVIELSMMKSPSLHNLLSSEIDLLSKIKHQNILNCFEIFTSSNNCYIITELCDGDLESLVKKTGPLDQKSARKIIFDILEGLVYLAKQQIVHRDIKTSNIFMKNGVAKIADFGFAKKALQNFKDLRIGTPICMAPEGLVENMYGSKTDVWAFGVVLYQILHGTSPFAFCQSDIQLISHVNIPIGQQRLNQIISAQLRNLIKVCLQTDWRKRPTMIQLLNHPYVMGLKMQFGKNESLIVPTQSILQKRMSSNRSSFSHQIIESNPSQFLLSLGQKKQSIIDKKSFDPIEPQTSSFIKHRQNKSDSNIDINNQKLRKRSLSLSANNDIILSRLSMHEALQLLHYCRLLYKTRQLLLLHPQLSKFPIIDCLGNKILQFITQFKRKFSNFVVCQGQRAMFTQQKLQEAVDEYYQKYTTDIRVNLQIKSDNQTLQKYCTSALRLIDSFSNQVINRRDQIIAATYTKQVSDINRAIENCVSNKNYSTLINFFKIEEFLKIKYQDFDETYYTAVRAKLAETH